jgi:fucose permease
MVAGVASEEAGARSMTMQDRKMIILSAVGYTVLWTVFMIAWTGTRELSSIGMLTLCGVFNGLFWYWLFYKGTRWVLGRRDPLRPKW